MNPHHENKYGFNLISNVIKWKRQKVEVDNKQVGPPAEGLQVFCPQDQAEVNT